jgi:hypothetical protein
LVGRVLEVISGRDAGAEQRSTGCMNSPQEGNEKNDDRPYPDAIRLGLAQGSTWFLLGRA